MATISVDFDSKGDVELVLKADEPTASGESSEKAASFMIGSMGFGIKELRLRVSAPKLISSSRYFEAMLEGSRFSEAQELKEHGFVKIELDAAEDNPEAMLVILGVLYNDSTQVPDSVGLAMLENITNLVDKYQWHTLVTPCAIAWFERLVESAGLPNGGTNDSFTWLWILWVFGIANHFKELSRRIVKHLKEPIDLSDEHNRLPSRVLESLNKQRESMFDELERIVHYVQADLLDESSISPVNAHYTDELALMRYTALGMLAVQCQTLGIGLFMANQHPGISLASLQDGLGSLPSLEQYKDKLIPVDSNPYGHQPFVRRPVGVNIDLTNRMNRWNFKTSLEKILVVLDTPQWGLDMDSLMHFTANLSDPKRDV